MPMNRVYIKTYGCQMNERDSDAVAAMLRGKGYSLSIMNRMPMSSFSTLVVCADQAEQKAIGKAGHQ